MPNIKMKSARVVFHSFPESANARLERYNLVNGESAWSGKIRTF